MLIPIERMQQRVAGARADSDTSLFYDLLFMGELVTKIIVVGVIAGIADDPDRHRYRLLHRLVRADGIGEWNAALVDATTGPASAFLSDGMRDDQRAISSNTMAGTWQHEAVTLLDTTLRQFDDPRDPLPQKISLQRWFALFAELRNKTRGHGAARAAACSLVCPGLEDSIRIVIDNMPLLAKPWAYLHRNLSGKYRVVALAGDQACFAHLKSAATETFQDGVYVFAGEPRRVDLMRTTVDIMDFYLPNGGFADSKFEMLSYVTDDRVLSDSAPYLAPVGQLPPSQTEGRADLTLVGNSFTNMPVLFSDYVQRRDLEAELLGVLLSDRHQMVTLVGRGGVGKTSTALSVLRQLAEAGNYFAILWFSARDIDLLERGPKLVTANVRGEQDIARELVRLFAPEAAREKGFSAIKYLAEHLTCSHEGPLLFVFDNFETVRNPRELYTWIDTYIRAPNKALITTRFREFRGDFDVPVPGMTEAECAVLIHQTAARLGIAHLITNEYIAELYRESDGHPYVVKVLLGEVAKEGHTLKIERIIARQDEILDALFERTYAGLSPGSRRVFLLLCTWRSAIPEIALESILLRPENERIDVGGSIDELSRMSLIELTTSDDDTVFVSVPLAAMVFGKRKLAVSPAKAAVEADAELLYTFGASRGGDARHGLAPKVERFFRAAAERIANGQGSLESYQPILEYLARGYPRGWLLLSELFEERERLGEARNAVERYLERETDPVSKSVAWQRLADLAAEDGDTAAEIHALVELGQQKSSTVDDISRVVNRVNGIIKAAPLAVHSDEKRILLQRLIEVMTQHIATASGTDLSRLAWLYIHLRDTDGAIRCVDLGLERDAGNEHLIRLEARLKADRARTSGTYRRL
jgi:hypothetical protein